MRHFRGPGRYVQGAGVLDDLATNLEAISAARAVIAGGETAVSLTESAIADGLDEADIDPAGTIAGIDHATESRVADVAGRVEEANADLLVGVGGGTAIDAAKAAATRTGFPFVSIPTIASTDAPASGLSVIYDDAGRPVDVVVRDRSPEVVLADTTLIAEAPPRFLRWGLGDALATAVETQACNARGGITTRHGGEPSDAGVALGRRCREVLEADGADALAAVARDEVTPAVERAVEVALLHSALGFESAGVAAAHALEVGSRLAGHTGPAHGDLVGVACLAARLLEDEQDVDDLVSLLVRLDFPECLPPDDLIDDAAEFACIDATSMDNEPVDVTPADAAAALREARDRLARAR